MKPQHGFPFLLWKRTHTFLKFHARTEAHIPPSLPLIMTRVEQGAPNHFETPQAWDHSTCLPGFWELMLRNIPGSQGGVLRRGCILCLPPRPWVVGTAEQLPSLQKSTAESHCPLFPACEGIGEWRYPVTDGWIPSLMYTCTCVRARVHVCAHACACRPF